MLVVSLVLMIAAILSTIFHIARLELKSVTTLIPIILQIIQLIELAWVIRLLVNLTTKIAINGAKTSWFQRFWKPEGRSAKGARGFSLALLAMSIFWAASLILNFFKIYSIAFFIFTLGTSWALTIFIITLINQTNRRASFLIKLLGIIMLTVFTGISAAAWLSAPVGQANFQASYAIPNRNSVHFEQNNATYAVSQSDFQFDTELGRKLDFPEGETTTSVNLLVTFPYAGKNWDQVLISQKGFILFEENPQNFNRLSLPQNPNPLIAALYLQDLTPSGNEGVYAHLTEEKSTFTWYLVPLLNNPDTSITTQLVLYANGSFDITFNGIHTNFQYSPYLPIQLQQVSGFFLGSNDNNPSRVQFNTQLPLESPAWSGVYQDYYIDFRNFLHQNMLMQLLAMLLVTIVMLLVFPIFLQNSMTKPIRTLRYGITQMTKGNYPDWLEPRYSDELGQTIVEFNQMVNHEKAQRLKSDIHIHELEEKLVQRTSELKKSIEKLAYEIQVRKSINDRLEDALSKAHKLSITDELTNCFNYAHIMQICEDEIKRAKRYSLPLSFMLVDPDYLRMINETYGARTGDEVLQSLAHVIQSSLRQTDFLGRMGGEEFAIIMPQTPGQEALLAANRLRNLIGSHMMETSKGPIRISASMGVVEFAEDGLLSIDFLIRRANQALDAAKNNGRNQAVFWNSDMETQPDK